MALINFIDITRVGQSLKNNIIPEKQDNQKAKLQNFTKGKPLVARSMKNVSKTQKIEYMYNKIIEEL